MKIKSGASIGIASLVVTWLLGLGSGTASASHTCPGDPSVCGRLGPLIPFHKDAIHAALVWTGEKHAEKRSKICFWMRPSEWRGTDLVDPNTGPLGTLKSTFEQVVYGGFRFSTGPHGLDASVTTRINADIPRDNGLCFDLTHPDAFESTGQVNVADLTEADFTLNAAAFSSAGHSRGLNYNIFCSGNVALADGRLLFVGGHDKAGNNGIRKLNIFDPRTETWVPRPVPPVKADFLADPTGLAFAHADPLNEANTDPSHSSDMKYQRWYPSAVTLPDRRVLILSGTDQDSSVGRANAAATKYRLNTPEVYDPVTDTTIALENARKVLSMYPPAHVIQTGPGKDDWKVAVIGEADHSVLGPEMKFAGDPSDVDRGINIRSYDPWPYSGKTYFLDVLAALNDPHRNLPAENHWAPAVKDDAAMAHESAAGAHLVELDAKGHAISQKVVLFGGGCGERPDDFPCNGATVEMIDFQAPSPTWKLQDSLIQPASQNNAVPLPNGKVLVIGGNRGRGRCSADGVTPAANWNNSFHYQVFDPAPPERPERGTITAVVQTTIPRHDHSTTLLLPDATVIAMGGNRTDLANDPCQAGLDTGVPVAQVYFPPYLSNGDRPLIEGAPDQISYRRSFVVSVSEGSGTIGSVALIRQDPQTHNWGWGRRYVKLWFTQQGTHLIVQAPAVPGLAVPGYYMLFVLNPEGVPSIAKLVHLDHDAQEHRDVHRHAHD